MKLIHLYMARRLLGAFLAILAVIVAVLSLENLSRLLTLVRNVGEPLALIGRFMLFLVPEYAAIGLLVALFLAIALAVRASAMAGEWQVFAAVGVPPRRLLLVPMMLACLCAAGQLGIRLYLQPAGESRIDALSVDIARGLYGFGGRAGEVIPLGDHAYATVAESDPGTGEVRGVFVSKEGIALTARRGRLSWDPAGLVRLELRDGAAVTMLRHVPRRISFAAWTLALPMGTAPALARSPSERLDRLALDELVGQARKESAAAGHPALAALVARASYAAFSLLLPFLAASLGTPALRGSRSLGIAAGLLLVTAFVRSTAWVETAFAAHPIAAAVIHLLAWSGIAALLWRREQNAGPGAAEGALGRLAGRATMLLRRPRPAPPVPPAPIERPVFIPVLVETMPPQAKAA